MTLDLLPGEQELEDSKSFAQRFRLVFVRVRRDIVGHRQM